MSFLPQGILLLAAVCVLPGYLQGEPPAFMEQWIPGAFVEVRILEQDESAQFETWLLEVTEVFTGPQDLLGQILPVNDRPLHLMPPERWVVYNAYHINPRGNPPQPGQVAMIWMARRSEIDFNLDNRFHGVESAAIKPVFKPDATQEDRRFKSQDWHWQNTTRLAEQLAEWSHLPQREQREAILRGLENPDREIASWSFRTLLRVEKAAALKPLRELAANPGSLPAHSALEIHKHLSGSLGASWRPDDKDRVSLTEHMRSLHAKLSAEDDEQDLWRKSNIEDLRRALDDADAKTAESDPDARLWRESVVVLEITDPGALPERRDFNNPQPPTLGRAKVVRVFTGEFEVGDEFQVMPGGRFTTGDRFISSVRRDRVFEPKPDPANYFWTPAHISGPWSDDEPNQFIGTFEPPLDVDELLAWVEKAAATPRSQFLEFFREASVSAPWPMALWSTAWALHFDPMLTLATIEKMQAEPGNNLRLLMLEDYIRMIIFGRLWQFDPKRGDLFASIVSVPLETETDARLVAAFFVSHVTDGGRLFRDVHQQKIARAIRANPTWQTLWPTQRVTGSLDFYTWWFVRLSACSRNDPQDAVDWLIERCTRPANWGSTWFLGWCNSLSLDLPLTEAQAASLRDALAENADFKERYSGKKDRDSLLEEIQARTWEDIGRRSRFP